MSAVIALGLGLVNWLATTLVVESEIFRPLRDWVARRELQSAVKHFLDDVPAGVPVELTGSTFWREAKYLVSCHMCVGVWVGIAETLCFGGPWRGFTGFVAASLLYKAIGHLVLELRPQAWPR